MNFTRFYQVQYAHVNLEGYIIVQYFQACAPMGGEDRFPPQHQDLTLFVRSVLLLKTMVIFKIALRGPRFVWGEQQEFS